MASIYSSFCCLLGSRKHLKFLRTSFERFSYEFPDYKSHMQSIARCGSLTHIKETSWKQNDFWGLKCCFLFTRIWPKIHKVLGERMGFQNYTNSVLGKCYSNEKYFLFPFTWWEVYFTLKNVFQKHVTWVECFDRRRRTFWRRFQTDPKKLSMTENKILKGLVCVFGCNKFCSKIVAA